jgi:hypothetical protein
MGEGVDPTKMCQSLMEKMRRFQQLMTAAEPELLVLFEEWLEALEDEAVSFVKEAGSLNPPELTKRLGLSPDGAAFLLNKLKKEGRI